MGINRRIRDFFKRKRQNYKKTMEENQNKDIEQQPEDAVVVDDVNPTPSEDAAADEVVAEGAVEAEDEVAKLKEEVAKEKKEYLFLMAEFDNFRKRTLKEKSELIRNGAESAFKGLLPIVDDFERALKASEGSDDAASLREGMELIYKKLKKFMEQNGVKEMDPEDKTFDSDKHEAISVVPVPDEEMKGKILDTVEKGYTINDKVLRHAKVVVGQ
ncbi:MAG: nucleotide exchange factor GrpE [Muribaculaceae bacterium]|nr:nucleotide exchange factor GrpE [Muribaculaceae bacterium]